MKILILFTKIICLLLIVMVTGCKDDDIKLELKNESNSSIYVQGTDLEHDSLYPDTAIFKYGVYISLMHQEKMYFSLPSDLQIYFDYLPADTFSIFIFDADTVKTYPWEKIRKEYMVLKRYDLSQEDLYRVNFKLTYPPNPKMRDIKMFPPYEEE